MFKKLRFYLTFVVVSKKVKKLEESVLLNRQTMQAALLAEGGVPTGMLLATGGYRHARCLRPGDTNVHATCVPAATKCVPRSDQRGVPMRIGDIFRQAKHTQGGTN